MGEKGEEVHSSWTKCVSASLNVTSKCCRWNLCNVRLSYCVPSIVLWCLHQASLEIYSWCTAAHSFRHAGVEKHECENTRCKLLKESTTMQRSERGMGSRHSLERQIWLQPLMRPPFSRANWFSFKRALQSSVEHLSSLFTVYVKQPIACSLKNRKNTMFSRTRTAGVMRNQVMFFVECNILRRLKQNSRWRSFSLVCFTQSECV